MNLLQFSAVMCRGVGLLLLLFGLSYLLPLLVYGPASVPRSAWTSYAPLAHDDLPTTFVVPSALLRTYLPAAAQFVSGLLLLLFSRAAGTLLASGLPDRPT